MNVDSHWPYRWTQTVLHSSRVAQELNNRGLDPRAFDRKVKLVPISSNHVLLLVWEEGN